MAVYPDMSSATDESVVHSYNLELQYRSNYEDALMGLEGVIPGGNIEKAPDAVMFTRTMGDMQVDDTSRMVMPLGGVVGMGDNSVREITGTELEFLTVKAFANSYFKVVDQKDVKRTLTGHAKGQAMFDAASPALIDYMQRTRGSFARQGFFDGASLNLTSAATSPPSGGFIAAKRARSWSILGATPSPTYTNNQVVYSATAATFDANIIAACITAAQNSAGNVPTVDTFNRLSYTALQTNRIKAIGSDYGGNLVDLVHPGLATFLRDQTTNGSIKNLQRTTYSEKIAAKAWSTDLGQLGRHLLIEDACSPIFVVAKDGSSCATIYRGTGETDPRAAYHNGTDSDYYVFHATLISGKGSIIHGVISNLMYDDQIRDMNTLIQLGASGIEGWTPMEWDEPIPANRTASTRKNQGGMVFLSYAYDLN